MWNLYATNREGKRRQVAAFGSEQQLLAYVRWATLRTNADGTRQFEQKTPLTGSVRYDYMQAAPDSKYVDLSFNPTPGML